MVVPNPPGGRGEVVEKKTRQSTHAPHHHHLVSSSQDFYSYFNGDQVYSH